jgi:hypothetical protein
VLFEPAEHPAGVAALGEDDEAAVRVRDVAGHAQRLRESVDMGPEPQPLNRARDFGAVRAG